MADNSLSERSRSNPFSDPDVTDEFGSTDSRSEMEQNTDFEVADIRSSDSEDFDCDDDKRLFSFLPHFDLPELNEPELAAFFQHPMVKNAFAEGVDLNEHRQTIFSELSVFTESTVVLYREEMENVSVLYSELLACDKILGNLDTALNSFENSLNSRIEEIHEMQKEAKQKLVGLTNSQHLELPW
eukprot:TRINITY_DN15165_c0_g1_i1.p1 TRINITY_DN15165_c0_g1~~TRINITY_DN15165_c0_g1_i1.p1  ORF type:complete len:185 (-),score=31.36 TRINITY_DN15165_c0_g1_i1:153-707(-)